MKVSDRTGAPAPERGKASPGASRRRAPAGVIAGLLGVLVLLGAAGPVDAAGVVRGRVTDSETEEMLGYASAVAESGERRTGVIADATGTFELRLDPGEWVLRVSFLGYLAFQDTVRVRDGMEQILEVALVASAIPLEPVQVRADRLSPEGAQPSVAVLDMKQIRALPAFGEVDPIRVLAYLPGVQAASDISSGLYVRGGGPDQTLILLDDVPIYNPVHAFGLFSAFNPDAVDKVVLYKGAYPAKYSGRLGAVLDVRSVDNRPEAVHGTVGISTIAGRMSLQGPVGRGSWFLAGRRTYLDPILDYLRRSDSQIPSYYFYDLNGRVEFPGLGTDRFEWSGFMGQDDLRLDLDQDSFLEQRWGNRAMSLSYRLLLGNSLVGRVAASTSEYRSRTEVSFLTTPAMFGNHLRDYSLRADATFDGFEHRVTTGAQTTLYDFEFEQEFNGENQITFASKPWDVSVFAEDVWSPDERTEIRAGLRTRWFSEGSRLLWEPRASVALPVADRTRLRLATGIYHQYLQLIATEGFSGADFYLPIDATLEPGFSWQTVAGFEFEPSREWRFTIEGYGTALRHLVLLDNNQVADQTETSSQAVFKSDGSGWAAGVELFAERRVGSVTGWIGYTLGWTRRKFVDVNGGSAFPPKYDRRHDLSTVLMWRTGPWTISNTFVYGTGQAFTPATGRYGVRNPATGSFSGFGTVLPGEKNSGRLLPYHRMDVAVTRDFRLFGKSAQAILQIFNLYSRRNEWFVQYDADEPDAGAEVVQQLPLIPSLGVSFAF